ncbi:hypothetical protein M408DRAFT_121046 [Serendipita vermifera MAFF 305830]|uniref:Uncharacterized protein n=1 Tax=Serendipita vermifera MAFF 305830 TaxID=933852 RepID=A0A0C3BCR1_SERVB|nr:hypothetical protein M408DRAFT_121046 [Serendipita vermifera MAFF 305830]
MTKKGSHFHSESWRVSSPTTQGMPHIIYSKLSPTLANFDLWIRLIKDQTPVAPRQDGKLSNGPASPSGETVGYVIRLECLIRFVDHCDAAIQSMEIEEGATEGSNVELDPGGTCALAIQHFSKFGTTLLRMGEGPNGIALENEMGEDGWFGFLTLLQGFALRHSKYEGPSELYRRTTRIAQRGG